jgi:multiple sugar transport system permease protein
MTRGTTSHKYLTLTYLASAIRNSAAYIILFFIAVTTIMPFLVMIVYSITWNPKALTFPVKWIPDPMTLYNYGVLFARTQIVRWIINSFIICGVSTAGALITSSMAGYAFARGNFVGKNVLFTLFLGILMVPLEARIVPVFIVLAKLNLVNTYAALIGPSFASIFGTFMLRQFYLGIPRDYDDAAVIDGANRFQVYWKVLLPQLTPALATLAVLRFMGVWNEFLYPLVVTTSATMRTVTVGLATIITGASIGGVGIDMAGAVVGFIPTLAFFLLGQRYLIEGISLSGVKG